jgi:D-inositol-3-phosphate glycosyltransferase
MPEKQKVIIIGSAYPLRGGLATYNERLARAYLQQGDDVEIVTFSLQYPNFLFPGKTQFSSESSPRDLSISVVLNSINPFNWISTGFKLKKKKPDLVIIKFWIPFMAPCLGTVARIIRSNRHSKVISIIDNIIPHEKRPGDRALARYFVNSVDGFIAMSKSVLGELNLFDSKKPKAFCPHPLYDNFGSMVPKYEAKRSLNLDQGMNYILFFGFIRDYKGLDLLIKALATEKFNDMPLKLLVAGEFYMDPKPILSLIEDLGLKDRVILSNDFIPDSDVYKYFCASDVVVQPYKSATQSGVTQIAYHFNKPMIITRVGGLEEFVPDGKAGFVVEPDPAQIADAILRFYKEGLEEKFSAGAETEKLNYSWERLTGEIGRLQSLIK